MTNVVDVDFALQRDIVIMPITHLKSLKYIMYCQILFIVKPERHFV